jgi:PAS domain S-box-containing protein
MQGLESAGRLAEQTALGTELDRLQGVLDSIAEGFVLLDPNFIVQDINAAGLRMDGRPREALVGRSHWEVFPASVGTPVEAAYRRAMTDRAPVELEHRYLDLEAGVDVWLDIRAYPGTQGGLALFYRDVSENKRAAAALKASNERFRAAVDAVRGVLWTNDAAGRMLGEQPGWAALTGQSYEQYQGYGWAEAVHADDRQATLDSWNQAVAERKTFLFEHRLRRHDGQWRLFSVRAVPVVDAQGAITEWVGVHTDVTEQRELDDALRQSEARFRLMADAAPQIVWITDAEGRTEFFNKHWSDYTGVAYRASTAAEVAADFVHPEDVAATVSAFEEARRSGGTFQVEHRIRSREGNYRWFLVRGEPYRDPASGRIARWFGASVDIDDRKLAEERLRELNLSLERRVAETAADLDRAWRNASDIFAVIDHEGTFHRVNPAATAILGWTEDEMIGRSLFEFIHPDDHAASIGALQHARSDVLPTFQNRYRAKGGGLRTISWVAAPEGPMVYAYGRDVTAETEQRARLEAVESARREADALYRAYFENTPEALFVIGVDAAGGFSVEQVNPAHEAGVGLKLEEIRGKRIEEILPPDIALRVAETYRRVVTTGETFQYREVFDLGGDPRHWDTSLVPVRDADGQVVRLIGSSRDVTRQIVAEEALRQSQKMEAIGQLTGGVAHDFNNLLTVIRGSVELLRRPNISEERRVRYVDAIGETADRAATLTGQLLAFARRQALRPEVFDPRASLQALGVVLRTLTGARVTIEMNMADAPCWVDADRGQFDTALINMAVNARDAMGAEGLLTIAVEPVSRIPPIRGQSAAEGEFVAICVTDTGEGIPPELAERVFEPFFTTKPVGQGTGLGLSQVFGFAKQSGGEVEVRSEPGKGATFVLYLPRAAAPAESRAEGASAPRSDGQGVCVLVVEDNREVGEFATHALAELGYRSVWAANAEAALAELDADPDRFHIVFSDVVMPGMNGVQLGQEIRRRHGAMPVLLASGYSHVLAEHNDHGFELLHKPYSIEELSRMLRSAMTTAGGAPDRNPPPQSARSPQ